jgi:hypothetical protein
VAWKDWQHKPFPRTQSDDEGIADRLDDVIEFDAWAAGLIFESRPCEKLWPHELKTDRELRARIEHRLADPDPVAVADARAWRAYLDDLESRIVLAQRAREETRLRREPGSRPRPSGAS